MPRKKSRDEKETKMLTSINLVSIDRASGRFKDFHLPWQTGNHQVAQIDLLPSTTELTAEAIYI
jgi:hypothetical protein